MTIVHLPPNHTMDALLEGRVVIAQPAQGFRAGIDAVLLSACVPVAKPAEQVLDVGCGVGSAGICYGVRTQSTAPLHLLDANPEFAPYIAQNIQANGLTTATAHTADISTPTPLQNDSITHILTNPPYETARQSTPSPHASKSMANAETTADLPCWVNYCHRVLKRGGTLSMIHRADRIHHVLHALHGDKPNSQFGDIHILPVQSVATKPAIRILVHARKDTGGGCIVHAPLVLQTPNATGNGAEYTPQAEKILRDGESINWHDLP